jgi:3',5'-cyclic AMP phosphodiesterase CpdA
LSPTPPGAVRLAHFSDIHITTRSSWQREDWLNKRMGAWINLRILGRGYRFRRAERVLSALAGELSRRAIDHVVFSGDATALGFEEEMARAAHLLRVGELPGLAVPGNHDYCTRAAMRSGHFEQHFAPWQVGERVDDAVYPFAQRVGDVWLVAVNSATANRWAWDASGAVGADQIDRLRRLLARLDDHGGGPRILVTHYPVVRASGKRESRVRMLRDLDVLLSVAAQGGVGLWLHGHRHDTYVHRPPAPAPFPIICAGSATQTGRWSYAEYTIAGPRLHAQRRIYDRRSHTFRDGVTFELELPSQAALGTGERRA